MNLTEEQLKIVREMAELFFLPEEIAINLEVDPVEFSEAIRICSTPVAKAFLGGQLRGDLQLRKAISQAAHNGSNPAQQVMMTFLNRAKINQL